MSDELYEPQAGDSLYRFKCFVYPLNSHKPFDVREGSWVEQVCYRCCEHHARRYLLEVAQAVGFHVRWFELLEKGDGHYPTLYQPGHIWELWVDLTTVPEARQQEFEDALERNGWGTPIRKDNQEGRRRWVYEVVAHADEDANGLAFELQVLADALNLLGVTVYHMIDRGEDV